MTIYELMIVTPPLPLQTPVRRPFMKQIYAPSRTYALICWYNIIDMFRFERIRSKLPGVVSEAARALLPSSLLHWYAADIPRHRPLRPLLSL